MDLSTDVFIAMVTCQENIFDPVSLLYAGDKSVYRSGRSTTNRNVYVDNNTLINIR